MMANVVFYLSTAFVQLAAGADVAVHNDEVNRHRQCICTCPYIFTYLYDNISRLGGNTGQC